MSDPQAYILADGLLYPTPVWLGALSEAVLRLVERRIPEGASVRQVARVLRDVKDDRNLHLVHREACEILAAAGVGVSPSSLAGDFEVEAVFPVDNAVPPR